MTLKRRVLNELIEETALLAEAKKRNLEVTAEELDSALADITRDYTPESFDEQLKAQHLSKSRFRDRVRTRILIGKLIKSVAKGGAEPSAAAVEAFYKEHPDQFRKAEQTHLAQIVVKTQEDADRLLEELKGGASFEQLARDHSFTPEASQGGDLGFVPKGVMPAGVEEEMESLKIGKASRVVKTDYGFHILKIVERRPEHIETLEEARPGIASLLTEKDRDANYSAWRRELLSKAKIERNHGLLANIH
jgi:peptidyl-prolyl cis-trans isomerase C